MDEYRNKGSPRAVLLPVNNVRHSIILACVLALVITSGPTNQHVPTLGCEGDSQTMARAPITDAQTYCSIAAGRLGWNHLNFAVAGSTTQDVLNRLPVDLAYPECCDCFLVQIGANDSFIPPTTNSSEPPEWMAPIYPLSGVTLAQFQSNLSVIATQIRVASIPVTFVTQWAFFSTPELVQQQFYVDAMKDTAAQLDPPVPVVDMFSLQLGGVWWNYGNNRAAFWSTYEVDYQHPSAAGHAWEASQFTKPRYRASCAFHS